jgi:predicted ATPase/DNA-binding winged helix-turn-helix (wHTH) protein
MLQRGDRPVYESGRWEIDLSRHELRADGVAVPLGGRAFEIIAELVQSAGELVTKDQLMGRVWPGTIVEESALHVHISAVRKALGPDRAMLRNVFGRGYRLVGNWTIRSESVSADPAGPERLPSPASPAAFSTNFPMGTPDLVGRQAAAQHVQDLLSAYRTVTLTGPGGIGKTALALKTARSLFPTFDGDGFIVELASLSEASLVVSAVAGVLALNLGGNGISSEAIARAIGTKKLLLILDNCEHVIDAAAEFVETIIRMCPQTSLLATSREALRIDGEHSYCVTPLDVPLQDQEEASSVLGCSSVQLFIARTSALRSDFSPNGDNLPVIAGICRRLDGIPLAIEFAAARAAVLGVQEIASRLDDRFRLLIAGRRTALPRHRTLRATLDWSYELLPEPERCLLRRLGIFPAGFTLEAATAIMSDTGTAVPAVVEGIANLVSKSLVMLDGSVAAPRWRMLETIRAYALEKLADSGEAEQIAWRHAQFFRDLFAPAAGLQPSAQDLAGYAREIDNVRTALNWAFSDRGQATTGIMLTAAYVPVWLQMLLMVECNERVERALESLAVDQTLDAHCKAELNITLGFALLNTKGLADRTRTVLADALEQADRLDDTALRMRALWANWSVQFNIGDYRKALSAASRLVDVADQAADHSALLVGHRILGSALHFLGDQPEAERHLNRALEDQAVPQLARQMWYLLDQRIVALAMLARVLCIRGRIDQARRIAQTSLGEAEQADDRLGICYALRNAVIPVRLMLGDYPSAEKSMTKLEDVVRRNGMAFWLSWSQCLQGQLLIKRGEFSVGSSVLASALDSRMTAGWMMRSPEFLGTLSEGMAGTGKLAEAEATIDKAIAQSKRGEECWILPELLRLKGEMLLQQNVSGSASAADGIFAQAAELACEQGALFWELRIAVSWARLKVKQKERNEARQSLASIYGRFTEGLDTGDLELARALLDSLR